MSFDVLARMTYSALRASPNVEFMWHGGEPTLLPISFYEKALLLQARLSGGSHTVSNSLQTNGTRITPAWASFFRANDFNIGVSIDGPSVSHDASRVTVGGRSTSAEVAQSLSILREFGVPFGVLMVVDAPMLRLGARRVFSFMVETGLRSVGFIGVKPVNDPGAEPGTRTEHYVTPAQMSGFLIDMYDCWLENGDYGIHIRELDGISSRIVGSARGPCTLMGGCFGDYFAVESDGTISHCDVFLGDQDYVVGNVLEDDFATIRSSSKMAKLRAEDESRLTVLMQCKHFSICNGWCPHERYSAFRHDLSWQPGCCGLSALIEHVQSTGGPSAVMTH